MPHDSCQRTDRSLINVGNLKLCRIQLVSGSHTTDDRDLCLFCTHDNLDFGCNRIYGIHHIGIFLKRKLICILRQKKTFSNLNLRVRINRVNPFFHHFYFRLSHCIMRCNNLTIQIGKTDIILIYQNKGADSASCQCFHDITTNTANPKDYNLRFFQYPNRFFSNQKPGTLQFFSHFFHSPGLLLIAFPVFQSKAARCAADNFSFSD